MAASTYVQESRIQNNITASLYFYATFESATLAMKNGWKVSFTRRETDTIFLTRFVSITTLDFLLLFVFPAFVFPPSVDGGGWKKKEKRVNGGRVSSITGGGLLENQRNERICFSERRYSDRLKMWVKGDVNREEESEGKRYERSGFPRRKKRR